MVLSPRKHAALVAGLACVLHAPSWFRAFMDLDEASYAGIACRLLDGGVVYHDGVENKFPAIYYIYKGIYALFGRYNMVAIHVAVTLSAILTAWLVGAIARRYAGARAGQWAAVLYVVFSASYYPKMLAGNTEMFAVLPAALAVWCYVRARDGKLAWLLAAGAAGALALLCKQVALATFAALLADRALTGLREPLRALRDLALLMIGFAAVVIAMVLHLRALGVLDEAVFWTWTYVLHYYLPSGSGDHGFLFNFVTCFVPFMALMSPMVYLAVRGRDRAQSVLYWWLAGNIAAALVGGRMYGHYMLLFVPALATLAGIGAARRLTDERAREAAWLARCVGAIAIVFLAIAIFFEPLTESFLSPDPDWRVPAEYVRDRTQPSDRIFVWGWFPAFYQAADRCPSTRFVYTHILTGKGEAGGEARYHEVPEGWNMLMQDLQSAPPKYILDTSPGAYGFDFPPENYPQLWTFLAQHYTVEQTLAGVRIYSLRSQ